MATLIIEGDTLGEIHHKYNKLVNDAIKNKNVEITEINYDDSDFDNLFKIDIACKNHNVEYILKVLQCSDMLYVSRAIKKSPWLITDKQYAHVINPDYLFNVLRLQMTSKAFNKLMLKIRLLLRDEKRVEEFCNHYEEKDVKTALKWLPHCSTLFIEKILEKHANYYEIPPNLLIRLSEKTINILEIYLRCSQVYFSDEVLYKTVFVMKDDIKRYLDIIETNLHTTPKFTAKYTKILMTNCRHRITSNLDRYANKIDVPTFAKFLSEYEIKYFISSNVTNESLRSWFTGPQFKYFVYRLPSDVRFEFIKNIFIDKKEDDYDYDDKIIDGLIVPHRYAKTSCGKKETSQNIYTWYAFAPFEIAFTDLKKIIHVESNSNERIAILTVLLTAAGQNMQNIHRLLKYYRKHHLNEPFHFKIQFINIVLSKTKAYRYDKNTWNCLKYIFYNMEVYYESDNNVQSCVRSVLLYCLINNEPVSKIIEKKIEFDTLKQFRKNLTQDEQNKIFNYLLKLICSKIQNEKLQSEKEYDAMFWILEATLNLLYDWDKDLNDYPSIVENIKQLVQIKKENPTWEMDLKILYNKKKSWKKLLFAESFLVSSSRDIVLNALKHDAKLVETHKHHIEELLKDNKNLDIFFKKIRIYWSQSLASSFKVLLIDRLHQNYNHKPFITGLCTLLSQKEITEIIKMYAPSDTKIDWSQLDEVQIFIRKYLAMNLYLTRPQPLALLYDKGDYLQYALPSLNAILYNISSANLLENLKILINCPVSLQKHDIRNVILKLKHEDPTQSFSDIWNAYKNSSIRADIFEYSHKMLCKEKNEKSIKDKWELIKIFIDTLTPDENKRIYIALSKVENVPMSIRGEYWMKSYNFLNSLPRRANCGKLLDNLISNMANIMRFLDDNFVANIFMTSFSRKFCSKDYIYAQFVAKFLLSAATEKAQMKRYYKIFVPIIQNAFPKWNMKHEGHLYARKNLTKIIQHLSDRLDLLAVHENMVFPVKMFTEILDILQKKLPETENYIFLTIQKLGLKYITIMDKIIREDKEKDSESTFKTLTKHDFLNILHDKVTVDFAKTCVEHFKKDIANNFPSIYNLFAEALNHVLRIYANSNQMTTSKVLNAFLDDKEFIAGYLVVLEILPEFLSKCTNIELKKEILNKIGEHPNKEIKMHYAGLRYWKGVIYP